MQRGRAGPQADQIPSGSWHCQSYHNNSNAIDGRRGRRLCSFNVGKTAGLCASASCRMSGEDQRVIIYRPFALVDIILTYVPPRNPFYLKQMLEVCHRKGCLWYSWKDSAWEFSLDRLFAEFESDSYGDQLNSSFILKRLQDLPPTARAILAWGSLLGNTFSFTLIQKLLSGAFESLDDSSDPSKPGCRKENEIFSSQLAESAVEGLQAATQAYILIPAGDEDQFRFAAVLDLRRGFMANGPPAFHTIDTSKRRPPFESARMSKRCISTSRRH